MKIITYPDLFTFIECPILGEPGPDSIIEYGEVCETCGMETEKKFEYLDYCVDGWDGEEIISVHNQYAVTKQFANEITKSGIKGVRFQEMTVSKSDIFLSIYEKDDRELPQFMHMVLTGKARAGLHGWWDSEGVCAKCNRVIWKHTNRVTDALTASYSGNYGPPRQVIKNTWDGDDIFLLDDPGPPVLTRKFFDLFEKINVKEVVFHPAEWA